MNYLESAKRPRRYLIAIAATLAINGWLIYALLHGNIYPFAAPEHLIRVRIYPDAKTPHRVPPPTQPVAGPDRNRQ